MQTQNRPTSNYRIVSQLSAVKSGFLYRAIRNDDGSELDVFVLGNLNLEESRRIQKRVSLAKQLVHPFAARVMETVTSNFDETYFLEPRATNSLRQAVIRDNRRDARKLLVYGYQIASVVAAGHRLGLTHGDISPDTIRIRSDGSLQLDFVRSSFDSHQDPDLLSDKSFSAPELVRLSDADPAADAFSLSSLLMWLFSGSDDRSTFSTNKLRERMIAWESELQLAPENLDAFCEAIQEALRDDPTDRTTASILLGHLEKLVARDGSSLPINETFSTSNASFVLGQQASDPRPNHNTLEMTWDSNGSASAPAESPPKGALQIGRFRILQKLGEGGMGEVYKAEDPSDGTLVAIKILSRKVLASHAAIRRFQKEATLLGQIKSPYVTNLLEVNEDGGRHYLVMEFVSGLDLAQLMRKSSPFDEKVALSLIADTARGLVSAHEQEIIHRDIKPANILIADDRGWQRDDSVSLPLTQEMLKHFRVKLSDFGLARQLDQSESMQLTQAGSFLGTPHYMSPEQFSSQADISPATDVYALGVTLFQMLAGRLPFDAPDINRLIHLHCSESPPRLQTINPAVSDATSNIVQRALAKKGQDRYADAAQFLRDVERLLHGEATNIEVHPQLPPHDPSRVFEEVFEWQLKGTAADLWPYVSNTERINRAVGVPSVVYETKRDDQGRLRKYGAFRMAGLQIDWEEHPFEWVEGQRLGVLREFNRGPFVWFLSIVELFPQAAGGTLLRHTVRILPRGLLGRLVAKMEVTIKGKRNLDRVYGRIDQSVVSAATISPTADPFAKPESISLGRRRRLEQRLDQLAQEGIDPATIECIGSFLREAPSQELARIRPIALAKNFSVDADRLIVGCLAAAKAGLLDLRWDILCPTCRISSQVANTLQEIENHARCEVCDLDFEVDLANSVELIFRAHPEIREVDLRTYCIGGPEHFPHVVLQVRISPGQRVELTPVLSEGEYIFRSAQLPYQYRLRALPSKGTTHTEIVFAPESLPKVSSQVRAGRNVLTITNDYPCQLVVRLERSIPRQDVLTAAQASSMPAFRDLFPDESPQLGRLLNVATVTLLAIDVTKMDELFDKAGEGLVFSRVQHFHEAVKAAVRRQQGVFIEASGTSLLFAFEAPLDALRAMRDLVETRKKQLDLPIPMCAALHCGTALATSVEGRLTYFGSNVYHVQRSLRYTNSDELLISEAVTSDPAVGSAIRAWGMNVEVCDLPQLGRLGIRCQRVVLASPSLANGR